MSRSEVQVLLGPHKKSSLKNIKTISTMSMVNSDCNKNRRDSVSVRFVWLWRLVQLTYLLFFIIHHIVFGISMQMKYKLTNKTRKVEIGDNYVSIIKVSFNPIGG